MYHSIQPIALVNAAAGEFAFAVAGSFAFEEVADEDLSIREYFFTTTILKALLPLALILFVFMRDMLG